MKMGITYAGLVYMIVNTLLYSSDLDLSTILKYWGMFLLILLLNGFVIHAPIIATILQFGVAISMYLHARRRGSLG